LSTQSTQIWSVAAYMSLFLIVMEGESECFYDKKWSTWTDFIRDFKNYCTETHQVFATLDLQTVDRHNTRLNDDVIKYSADLKYTYVGTG